MRRSLLPFVVAALVLAGQLLPHERNVTPLRAAALFSGATFASPAAALLVPLGAYLAGGVAVGALRGDWSYGFHALAPVVYASVALCVLLGFALRSRRRALPIAAGTLAGAILFFLVTNFAVWWALGTFPPTAAGLALCYAAGLPFLLNSLVGDAAYALVLFGGLAFAERVLAARAAWR